MAEAQSALRELTEIDPKAAKFVAEIKDEHQRTALLLAAHSTRAGGRGRSQLTDLAAEMNSVNAMPYRARLVALGLEKTDLRDEAQRAAFFASYGAAMDGLALAGDWTEINAMMTLLEQASKDPAIWPLVKDDPLALVIWSRVRDPALLEFYHRNRDWLADPLASPRLAELAEGWTLDSALRRYAKHEQTLRSAVVDGGLGAFALALMWSHGALVDTAVKQFHLDPTETLSVVYMNPDTFRSNEHDAKAIGEQASWMATIYKEHPVVWFAAGMTPYALQLYRDAPAVAGSILEHYGADDIGVLLYGLFQQAHQIDAAATAVDRFGDVAIYVFSTYSDPQLAGPLGGYLVDPAIGIRAIPFVVQFGDEAFTRLRDDKRWAERYFEPDGRPRKDNMDWVKNVPLGAPFVVVGNWVKGYPNEWSELGWAAVDILTLPLFEQSFATSGAKGVATSGKIVSATKQAAHTAPAFARREATENWVRSLELYRGGSARGVARMTRLREVAKDAKGVAGSMISLSTKPVVIVAQKIKLGANKAIEAWRNLDPRTRLAINRGMLAIVMYIDITDRTLPHLDKIGRGIGDLIGRAAAGGVVLTGEAVNASVSRFSDELTSSSPSFRNALYWLVLLFLASGMIVFFWRTIHAHTASVRMRR
jgi:hypothetical protein